MQGYVDIPKTGAILSRDWLETQITKVIGVFVSLDNVEPLWVEADNGQDSFTVLRLHYSIE